MLASCDELSRFPPPEVANAIAVKRILREQKNLASNPVAGIVVVSQSPKVYHNRYYRGSIAGPGDSPYQGGTFEFELFLPSSYPMKPPKVRMLTKIYHPNIDKLGRICLDTLKGKWSPGAILAVSPCSSHPSCPGRFHPSQPRTCNSMMANSHAHPARSTDNGDCAADNPSFAILAQPGRSTERRRGETVERK